jgi:hypothetical protein
VTDSPAHNTPALTDADLKPWPAGGPLPPSVQAVVDRQLAAARAPLKIYIAMPYSSNPERWTLLAIKVFNLLMNLGHEPFCPHFGHFANQLQPHSYERWMRWCLAWLEQCDVLIRLPGRSTGADLERDHAELLGKPVIDTTASYPLALINHDWSPLWPLFSEALHLDEQVARQSMAMMAVPATPGELFTVRLMMQLSKLRREAGQHGLDELNETIYRLRDTAEALELLLPLRQPAAAATNRSATSEGL